MICYFLKSHTSGYWVRVRIMVFNASFGGETHRHAASHWQTLSQNVVLSSPHLSGIGTHNVSCDSHWLHK